MAFIYEELAEQLFDQIWHRLAVIHIAVRDAVLFRPVFDHQVQLEAKEPAHLGLSPGR